MNPTRSAEPALICRGRTRLCALPLSHVIETMRPLPVIPLAGMPSFVRGLSRIRGTPTPVVDVGYLLGSSEYGSPTRFILLRTADRSMALAVEAVLGIRELSPSSRGELPPLLRGASAAAVSAVGTLDAELLLFLETARLIPDEIARLVLDAQGSADSGGAP